MVKSLYSGVSGLKTHQQRMDVIGNNISNVNTVGNKADVVTFKDVYYQTKRSPSAATATLGGVNPRMVGYGVQMSTTSANMTQSGYTQSDNIYDMAINGNGFFQVMDSTGTIYYTRAGIFNIDESGYLVNADGYHVLGVNGDSTGQAASSEIIRVIIPDTDAHRSSATKLINGTNVTISVSAPSNYTNISVGFVDSTYPYATFSNNILSIYFNRTKQYESQEEFERAINLALQAGGINLPDDVELQFEFENIPDDPNSKAAANSVEGLEFTTSSSTCEFEYTFQRSGTTVNSHAYMSFSVDDVPSNDRIIINRGEDKAVNVKYENGVWNITINDESTYSEISDALKAYIKDHPEATNLTITGFQFPAGKDKGDIIHAWVEQTGGYDEKDPYVPAGGGGGTVNKQEPYPNGKAMQLRGVAKGDVTGSFDLSVLEKGAFANDYEVTFAYVSGYDKTKAVWDGNTLTVTVCANSTVAEVNEAIRTAANGDDRKIIRFNDISGLDYGVTTTSYTTAAGENVTVFTFVNGYTLTDTDGVGVWRDEYGRTIEQPQLISSYTGTKTANITLENVPDNVSLGSITDKTSTQSVANGVTTVNTTITFSSGYKATFTTTIAADGTATVAAPTWTDGTGANATAGTGKYNTTIDYTKDYPAPENIPTEKTTDIWNPGMRSAFFSGNPHISPKDGKDSFYTGVARALSTFALTDGRMGAAQTYDSFSDVTVQQDGRIIALHAVHGYIEIGRIDLANFVNPNGLAKAGGTNFRATVASGDPKLVIPGQDGGGVVLSGALEMSNVDLADEFTNMITTQRGYQANSRVITVSDTMLEELLSLKR